MKLVVGRIRDINKNVGKVYQKEMINYNTTRRRLVDCRENRKQTKYGRRYIRRNCDVTSIDGSEIKDEPLRTERCIYGILKHICSH